MAEEQQANLNDLSDLNLVKLLAKHDREIMRYIMMFLPSQVDAEEVMQRTAVKLWEKSADFDVTREFLPWALHRAYYEVLNYRKELARSKLVFSEEVMHLVAKEVGEQDSYLVEMKNALGQCLRKMNASDIELLQFRYSQSTSIADLASKSGRTAKSLYRRLDRIREIVAKCVSRQLDSSR